ncbi:hypothetical protein RND81_13G001500 [Saponaria officinalis]|uniref:Uncharacterized protein n=1 Tax=Saponaria officinalis TaxID=3572 RepID=A0AAW1GUH3_SAPOF
MKNVAKCDYWCELQNPVNHRVFERKLRPKLMAEGTSAWASRIASPLQITLILGEGGWLPVPHRARLAETRSQRHGAAAATGGELGLGRANNPLWKHALTWTRRTL